MDALPSSRAANRLLLREVVTLAWPAVLQGLVATVVLFTDRLFLGRYSTDALGSMSLSSPVIWSVFSVFSAYGAGVLAVIGRAVGARDPERARASLRAVLLFAAVVGAAVALAGVALRWHIADGLAGDQTSFAVRELAAQYMLIVFATAPLEFLATAGSVALQASGDTRTPMIIGGVTGAINLLLSWLLVYGHAGLPEMGVRGAAIGTAVAFSAQGLLTLLALWRPGILSLAARPERRTRFAQSVMPVLRVSTAAFGERALYHTAYVVFTGFIGHLGDLSMAAHQSVLAVESLGFIAANGFGGAAGALVAQKLGAGRPGDAAAGAYMSARLGSAALGAVGLLFLLVPEWCLAIITDDRQVIEHGAVCLRIAAIAQPMMALTSIFSGSLQGAGDTTSPMWAALIGPVVVRITGCYVLAYPLGLGLAGIWIGSTLDWSVRALWLGRVFRAGRWKTIQVL